MNVFDAALDRSARHQGRHAWIAAPGLILGASHAVFAEPPKAGRIEANALEELRLIPYGCTDLRITEFPTLVRTTGR